MPRPLAEWHNNAPVYDESELPFDDNAPTWESCAVDEEWLDEQAERWRPEIVSRKLLAFKPKGNVND